MTCIYTFRKPVSITINGKRTEYITYKNTVAKLLKSKDITLGLKDKIEPSLGSKIAKGETINIKRAQNINVFVDGKEIKELTPLNTVDELLKLEGVTLREKDKISPELNTKLAEGMDIRIIRVDSKLFKDTKPIDFATIIKTNSSLPNTTRRIVQKGSAGVRTITTNVNYEDGKEVSRNLVSEIISRKPISNIVVQGTYPLMPVSRGGNILPFSKIVNVRATAYWAVNGVGSTSTASGRLAVRDPNGYSTIAVDRHVFPYGTKLFIEGYGFAIAADTGTAIVGSRIDVYFNTYSEACRYGSKYVKVYVLK